MMNPYHLQFFNEDETDPVPVIRMVFALASPDGDVVVLKCPEKTQPLRGAAFKADFQADKYTSFDIWCAKASHETFLPVKEDDIFHKLLLRFRIFPNVYNEKRTEGLVKSVLRYHRNGCRSAGKQDKGYLGVFSGAGYAWDRGLGFSPEAAPSWDVGNVTGLQTRMG